MKYLIRGFATCGLAMQAIACLAGGSPSVIGIAASGLAFGASMFWDALTPPPPRDTDTEQIAQESLANTEPHYGC